MVAYIKQQPKELVSKPLRSFNWYKSSIRIPEIKKEEKPGKEKDKKSKKLKWNSTRRNGSVKYEYRFDKKWSRKTNLSRLLQMTLLVLLYCVFKKGSLFTPNFWRCNRLLQIVHKKKKKKV